MKNISYFLTRSANLHGSQPALFHGEFVRDYNWFDAQVNRLAAALRRKGLKPGDRVGVIVESQPRGLITLFGVLRAGMVLVPMSPKLHSKELAYMLVNSDAAGLIVGYSNLKGLVALRDELPKGLVILGIDAESVEGVYDFDACLAAEAATRVETPSDLGDLAWIFYTSGTTGRPKGAMHTHRSLLAMVNTQLCDIHLATLDDRVGYFAPISHGAGLMAFQHVARGAGHVFSPQSSFRADVFFETVERHRVTTAFMVPTMIQVLLEDGNAANRDISSLRTIYYGGAPMYVDRLKEAISLFGPIFVQGYAQGEAPLGCTYLPKNEHIATTPAAEKRLLSAGREGHLVEVRVFDDHDNQLPAGVPGEVVVRGELVMAGYWKNAEATSDTLRNGWLHTGDIGYLDEDGYLFITDRKKDLIITGGANVYPREIEEVLYSHPAVLEAAVFGVSDPKWGERIVAAVVRKQGFDLDEREVIEWCRAHLASFKKPSEVHFLPELPKSGYGKILKREIRARFSQAGR